MLISMMLSIGVWAATPAVDFKTITTLAPVSEDSGYFLEQPIAFDIDGSGNYYVLDGKAKTIFKWDKSGKFQGNIGGPGSGPGEMSLSGRGRPSGGLAVVGDLIYVYDGRKREVMTFGLDGVFKQGQPLESNRGRTLNFFVTADKRYLMHRRSFDDGKVLSQIKLMNADGGDAQTFYKDEDGAFRASGGGNSGGGRPRFSITAFAPETISHFHRQSGELVIGTGAEPSFEVVGLDGKRRKVNVSLVQRDVTDADKKEFEQLFQNFSGGGRRGGGGGGGPQVDFAEKMPFYNRILHLGDQGFLVYTESPYNHQIVGFHFDTKGAVKGRFQMTCGPDGGLMASMGRVLKIALNDDDEFVVSELSLGLPKESGGS